MDPKLLTKVDAIRRYIARNLIAGEVIVIHDSVEVRLPEDVHPVHTLIVKGILEC